MKRALSVALLVCAGLPTAHAGYVLVTWLPAAGAVGYRIERASKPEGPWKVVRDTLPDSGRVSDLQAEAIDGLRPGQHCVRVSTVWAESQVSTPSEVLCTRLPRAEINFGKLNTVELPPVVSLEWKYCAGENEQCAFTGTKRVRYGKPGAWVELTATNGLTCSNGAFGRDPLPGNWKFCEVESPLF